MSKIQTEVTGTITRPADNTVMFCNDDGTREWPVVYPDDVSVIGVTDMDGMMWVYTVPAGYNILVDDGDIVNKNEILALIDE